MKIYIALFTTLIAAGHFTNVSAADATASVDGASHPHLRALADAAVDVACGGGYCNNDNQCGRDEVCSDGGSGGCSGKCSVLRCGGSTCYSNGEGCYEGTTCDPLAESVTYPGCKECRSANQSAPLRASILKEE